MKLVDAIREYYEKRKDLIFPNFDNAMKFAIGEVGEVYDVDLDRLANWGRNHPENKPKFSKERLGEELGDVIMMVMVAGMAEGVDPIESLINKMNRKLKDRSLEPIQYKTKFSPDEFEVKNG